METASPHFRDKDDHDGRSKSPAKDKGAAGEPADEMNIKGVAAAANEKSRQRGQGLTTQTQFGGEKAFDGNRR